MTSKQKADDSLARASSGISDSTSGMGVVNQGATADDKTTRDTSLRALQTMVREMPQYQREAASFNGAVSITDYCLDACRESINSVCAVEQVRKSINGKLDLTLFLSQLQTCIRLLI